MNKQQLDLQQVRQLLNRSTAQINERTLSTLHATRLRALERHTARHAHAMTLSGHDKSGHWHAPGTHHKPYLWIVGLLLVASILSGIAYWYKTPGHDNSDVDIAILTDDLPLQVYVD
jgi:hypothetical protein